MARSFAGYVKARSGLLLGGVREHQSARFEVEAHARWWLDTICATNRAAGRDVGEVGVRSFRKDPEITAADGPRRGAPMTPRLRSYVAATQRGYESGLCDGTGKRFTSTLHRVKEWSGEGIDACYLAAVRWAEGEASTWQRRPELVRRGSSWMPAELPGSVYE